MGHSDSSDSSLDHSDTNAGIPLWLPHYSVCLLHHCHLGALTVLRSQSLWTRSLGQAVTQLPLRNLLPPPSPSIRRALLRLRLNFLPPRLLGLKRVPAICVNYLSDERIHVDVWPNCGRTSLTKHDVIEKSLSDTLFPPKTSKHTIAEDTPPIFVPLERLRELPSFTGPDVS